jgi:photosystem II stability/assembly factor-like uncharacterized protein
MVLVGFRSGSPTVAHSSDGISWTVITPGVTSRWLAVCWSAELGLFAAVSPFSDAGANRCVMTSPDGLTWTQRTTPATKGWYSIAWSGELGLFAAVSNSGDSQGIMTSPDGINWTLRTTPSLEFSYIVWAPEISMFIVTNSTNPSIVVSNNGINWTAYSVLPATRQYFGMVWSREQSKLVILDINTDAPGSYVVTSPVSLPASQNTLLLASPGYASINNSNGLISMSSMSISSINNVNVDQIPNYSTGQFYKADTFVGTKVYSQLVDTVNYTTNFQSNATEGGTFPNSFYSERFSATNVIFNAGGEGVVFNLDSGLNYTATKFECAIQFRITPPIYDQGYNLNFNGYSLKVGGDGLGQDFNVTFTDRFGTVLYSVPRTQLNTIGQLGIIRSYLGLSIYSISGSTATIIYTTTNVNYSNTTDKWFNFGALYRMPFEALFELQEYSFPYLRYPIDYLYVSSLATSSITTQNLSSAVLATSTINANTITSFVGNISTINTNFISSGSIQTSSVVLLEPSGEKSIMNCTSFLSLTPRNSGTRNWLDIASSSDGMKLVAADAGGYLYTSTDGGISWTARATNLGNQAWVSVASSTDGTKLVAVQGNNTGKIYTSSNSGETWSESNSIAAQWVSVASSANGQNLIAVVNNGQIYKSTDSGVNWTARYTSKVWRGVASSSDGMKLVAVVNNGNIYTSTDGGDNWTERVYTKLWFSVASSADGTKLIACDLGTGSGGQIYISTDSGVTWNPRYINKVWIAVASSADGMRLAAVASGEQIHITVDGGLTWSVSSNNGNWSSIALSSDGFKVAATVQTGQIHTGGFNIITEIDSIVRTPQLWTSEISSGHAIISSIDTNVITFDYVYILSTSIANMDELNVTTISTAEVYTSSLVLYESGENSIMNLAINEIISESSAGVKDWQSIATSANGLKLVAVVYGGLIYTSTDGGVTWTERAASLGNKNWQCVASSADGVKLVAAANGDYIYTSSDSGVSWTQQLDSSTAQWSDISSSADGTLLAAVAENSVYVSNNSGVNWNSQYISPENWKCITSSANGQYLAIGSQGSKIRRSSDYGVTWTQTNSVDAYWSGIASSADGSKLVAVVYNNSGSGYIYTSTDYGLNWTQRATDLGSRLWWRVASSTDGVTLVAIDGDQIYKSTDSGLTWVPVQPSLIQQWYDICISSDGRKFVAIVYDGSIYIGSGSKTIQIDSKVSMPEISSAIITTNTLNNAVGNISSLNTNTISSSVANISTINTQNVSSAIVATSSIQLVNTKTILGNSAGATNPGTSVVAIGHLAGNTNQSNYAISLGYTAGRTNQGSNAIAIGNGAGETNQIANSIILNASNAALNATTNAGFYVNPVRNASNTNVVYYNTTTKELTYDTAPSVVSTFNSMSTGIATIGDLFVSTIVMPGIRIGTGAGASNQDFPCIAIGEYAGQSSQSAYAVAIGSYTGNDNQGTNAVALGSSAGQTSQGTNSIAIGTTAGNNNQANASIAIGPSCGQETQGLQAVAVGPSAGQLSQGSRAVSIGLYSGQDTQGTNAVAIGYDAGRTNQKPDAVAIGVAAGNYNQASNAVAVGGLAGHSNQASNAVAIGNYAGYESQGIQAVAIGSNAGRTNQGSNAIAIGNGAGETNQIANSIILNASNVGLNATTNAGFYVNPVRNASNANVVYYNTTTKELTYDTAPSGSVVSTFNIMSTGTASIGSLTTSSINIYELSSVTSKINVSTTFLTTPRETSRSWRSIASSADGSKLIAGVNISGNVYISTDGGVTWEGRLFDAFWQGVASSADGTKLVAVPYSGQIQVSSDGGFMWAPRESSRQWSAVASSADGTKLVATVYEGNIYTSTDSGLSWTPRDSTRKWQGVASSSDGTKLVAIVDTGKIYTSTDSGETWTPRDSNRNWNGVTSSSDGTKLAAIINSGFIYVSIDSGVTWTPRATSQAWGGITSSADGSKYIATVYNGPIYTSIDGGMTWSTYETSRSWKSIASSTDASKFAIAVQNGQIYTGVWYNRLTTNSLLTVSDYNVSRFIGKSTTAPTGQDGALYEGDLYYNTTTGGMNCYINNTWSNVGSSENITVKTITYNSEPSESPSLLWDYGTSNAFSIYRPSNTRSLHFSNSATSYDQLKLNENGTSEFLSTLIVKDTVEVLSTIVLGKYGPPTGFNSYTFVKTGLFQTPTGFLRTASGSAWNAYAYVPSAFLTTAYVAASPSASAFMSFGFDNSSAVVTSTQIDYCWYFDGTNVDIYVNGVLIQSGLTYSTTSKYSIWYDGTQVIFEIDGVFIYQTGRALGPPLYFNVSIFSESASINNLVLNTTNYILPTTITKVNNGIYMSVPNGNLEIGTSSINASGNIKGKLFYTDYVLSGTVAPGGIAQLLMPLNTTGMFLFSAYLQTNTAVNIAGILMVSNQTISNIATIFSNSMTALGTLTTYLSIQNNSMTGSPIMITIQRFGL